MKKKETQNKYIYVVLVKALTGLGKFARWSGGYDYTHIAVCLDEKLDRFYTFSRRKHYAPFDCGFMIETLDCYAFGKHKDIKLKVFKVPVLEEKRKKIEDYIEKVSQDSGYLFNFFSMITMSVLHGFSIYKTHNCMSFVSKVIALSGAVALEKPYYKYNIKETDELLTEYFYVEDFFVKEKQETEGYMDKVGFMKNALYFINLNSRLIYRMIAKGNGKDEG